MKGRGIKWIARKRGIEGGGREGKREERRNKGRERGTEAH